MRHHPSAIRASVHQQINISLPNYYIYYLIKNLKIRRLLIFLWLLFPQSLIAQSKSLLEGKWKVFAMQDKDMYINIKTDSVALPSKSNKEDDETKSKQMAALMLQVFGQNIFIFGSKGEFEMLHEGISDGVGIYTINKTKNTIETIVKRNGLTVKETMMFALKDNQLHLTLVWEDDVKVKLFLEKGNH
jgi:hypothetical protein